MNTNLNYYSESIVLSLCKEIEYIRSRSKSINQSLRLCQNKILSNRLRSELKKLNDNRSKILNISKILITSNCNNLSIEFLFELSRRTKPIKTNLTN